MENETQPVNDEDVKMLFVCCECGNKMACIEFKSTVKRLAYKYKCNSESCPKKPEFWWSFSNFNIMG